MIQGKNGKGVTHRWFDQIWVKVTQKWLDQIWVTTESTKRRAKEEFTGSDYNELLIIGKGHDVIRQSAV
jgi:hypothetical protein